MIRNANPEQIDISITAITKALKSMTLLTKLSYIDAKLLSLLTTHMQKTDRDQLSKRIISILESDDSTLYEHLFISLAQILKYLTESTCHEFIEKLLILYNKDNASHGIDFDRIASLGSVYHLATNSQQEQIFVLLTKALSIKFSNHGDSIAGVISTQMQHFTNEQLKHFVQLKDDSEFPCHLRLKPIAQAQINLNNYRRIDADLDDPTTSVRRLFGNN